MTPTGRRRSAAAVASWLAGLIPGAAGIYSGLCYWFGYRAGRKSVLHATYVEFPAGINRTVTLPPGDYVVTSDGEFG